MRPSGPLHLVAVPFTSRTYPIPLRRGSGQPITSTASPKLRESKGRAVTVRRLRRLFGCDPEPTSGSSLHARLHPHLQANRWARAGQAPLGGLQSRPGTSGLGRSKTLTAHPAPRPDESGVFYRGNTAACSTPILVAQKATPTLFIEVPQHPHLSKYHGTLVYGRSQQRNYASRYDEQRNYASRYDELRNYGSRPCHAPGSATQFASSYHEQTMPRVRVKLGFPPKSQPRNQSHFPQGVDYHTPDQRE